MAYPDAVSHSFSVLAARFRANAEAIKAEFACPVLLWEAVGAVHGETWDKTRAHGGGAPMAGDPQVIKLIKGSSSHNAFALGITVGRVTNNDVALPDDSVSRFHAFFQFDERKKEWTITDAESKNGTFHEEVRLVANQHVPLRDGSRLRFGDMRVQFLLPASFLAMLER